jgi:glycolate oxidase
VAPRTKIAATLRFISGVARRSGLVISNIFHAGDGNMHPLVLFDARKPGEWERARAASEEILAYCIEAGGSITGEHGVGMEKNELMPKMFSPDTLDMMRALKDLFDPTGRLNPGKALPTGRGCLEIRPPALERPASSAAGLPLG